MNESETREELIDPKLKACGWGVVEGSKVLGEYQITASKIQTDGVLSMNMIVDLEELKKSILQKAFRGELREKEISV